MSCSLETQCQLSRVIWVEIPEFKDSHSSSLFDHTVTTNER